MADEALFIAGVIVLLLASLAAISRRPLSRWAGRLAAGGGGVSDERVRQMRIRVQGSSGAVVWNAAVLALAGAVMVTFGIFGR